MTYRWEVESTIEVGRSRPAKRYMVATLGGYFPVLAKLGGNSLAAVHRTGDLHNGARGRLEMTFSHDGGESWTAGRVVADHANDCRNPALGVTSGGAMVLAYVSAEYETGRPDSWTGFGALYVRRSEDGGASWSEPQRFDGDVSEVTGLEGGASPYGKIVELADGTLLMDIYAHMNPAGSGHSTYTIRSRDGGRTWGEPARIPVDNGDETALLALPSGAVLAAVRCSGANVVERVRVTSSRDGGYTWSEARAATGPTQIPADLLRLADGRVLMTFGHRSAPFGVRALVSRDDGRTWDSENAVTLAADSARADCGYPSSAQMDDGSIFTAYYAYESAGPFQDNRIKGAFGMNYGPHCAGVKYSPGDLP